MTNKPEEDPVGFLNLDFQLICKFPGQRTRSRSRCLPHTQTFSTRAPVLQPLLLNSLKLIPSDIMEESYFSCW